MCFSTLSDKFDLKLQTTNKRAFDILYLCNDLNSNIPY